MDVATLAAAAAAISSPRTTRSTASAALAIAVDDTKTSLRTAKSLAVALRTALGLAGYLPALISAGERMLVYDDINSEYIAAAEAAIDLEDMLPFPEEGCMGRRNRRSGTAQAIHSGDRPANGSRRACMSRVWPPANSNVEDTGSDKRVWTKAQNIPSVQGEDSNGQALQPSYHLRHLLP